MKNCKDRLVLGGDFYDHNCLFECELKRGHKGEHYESGFTNGRSWEIRWVDQRSGRQKFFDWYDEFCYQWRVFWREQVFWRIRRILRPKEL